MSLLADPKPPAELPPGRHEEWLRWYRVFVRLGKWPKEAARMAMLKVVSDAGEKVKDPGLFS